MLWVIHAFFSHLSFDFDLKIVINCHKLSWLVDQKLINCVSIQTFKHSVLKFKNFRMFKFTFAFAIEYTCMVQDKLKYIRLVIIFFYSSSTSTSVVNCRTPFQFHHSNMGTTNQCIILWHIPLRDTTDTNNWWSSNSCLPFM